MQALAAFLAAEAMMPAMVMQRRRSRQSKATGGRGSGGIRAVCTYETRRTCLREFEQMRREEWGRIAVSRRAAARVYGSHEPADDEELLLYG